MHLIKGKNFNFKNLWHFVTPILWQLCHKDFNKHLTFVNSLPENSLPQLKPWLKWE